MQLSNLPARIQLPFANAGSKRVIPVASQIGITAGAASYTDGFPPLTFTPLNAGGVPPAGQDFNGILNAITAVQQWQAAGGLFTYDSAWSSANNGYPKGAQLLRADGTGVWVSAVDNNTSNPDTGGANWVSGSGRLINIQVFSTNGTFTYTPTLGTRWVRPRVQGAGGGGGGVVSTSSGAFGSIGSGGSAGAYGESLILTGFSGVSLTVGAAGTPTAGASGGTGGSSSFGSAITAPGGPGGAAGSNSAVSSNLYQPGSPNSSLATGGNILNADGEGSSLSLAIAQDTFVSSRGGRSFFGPGGAPRSTGDIGGSRGVAGNNAASFGAGGGGAGAISASPTAYAGGQAGRGIIIVEEFA